MKDYFKYLFSNLENWPWMLAILVFTFIAYVTSNEPVIFFWLIPFCTMTYRSIKMYKEKKNNTTS